MNPIKVNGSEKHNRALGREWLVESFTSDDWRLPWRMVIPGLRLKTHDEAIESAIEEHQKWEVPVRVHNVYTGDVESVSTEPVIAVKPQPNAGRIAVEHGRTESERY